jgi:tetratricopeptide (TPR) repeat protein
MKTIEQSFLAHLKQDLWERRIARGMSLLEKNRRVLSALRPDQPEAGVLLGYVAQWIDLGFEDRELLARVLKRFQTPTRAHLKLCDYLHLRMSEGLLAMAGESFDAAIAHFDFVLMVGEEIEDKETLAIADFWKGRCLRRKGEYDLALTCTVRGCELANSLGHPKMGAVMRVLESWLVFQKGRPQEALKILQGAEEALAPTDDYITLGNIYSSYGRIARRDGRYHQAIDDFSRAIAEYKKRDPEHRNVARSLANLAFVKRLIALELLRKLDAENIKRRKGGAEKPKPPGSRNQRKQRFQELREEAFDHLEEARAIYLKRPNHHGLGTVHLNFGYLYLDTGELDQAEAHAAAAFKLGDETTDFIIMARARLLQCMVENAKVEEEIGGAADPGAHARSALQFATDAVELSQHTQNRRLLANSYIWEGLTHCNSYFENLESARQSYDTVMKFLKDYRPDYMRADLQKLKSRAFEAGTVNSTLRAWSQGALGEKTFQQVTEEFAELVIPKVWEREGRKVSRVAARLSISPKKVRRILNRAGRKRPGNS